ncbi:Hypothetical predicted protein [Pelobates cultripes]|uniref:Uncharacterized protein n=1 Tax=Pelobates cultripes TaxID=61616 RepID=A0AAD1TIB5_PELCU|nr:Hypothetical predicted protein [Pelobates cultripes]
MATAPITSRRTEAAALEQRPGTFHKPKQTRPPSTDSGPQTSSSCGLGSSLHCLRQHLSPLLAELWGLKWDSNPAQKRGETGHENRLHFIPEGDASRHGRSIALLANKYPSYPAIKVKHKGLEYSQDASQISIAAGTTKQLLILYN